MPGKGCVHTSRSGCSTGSCHSANAARVTPFRYLDTTGSARDPTRTNGAGTTWGTKTSRKVSFLDTKPACMTGVRNSRPYRCTMFSRASCGRSFRAVKGEASRSSCAGTSTRNPGTATEFESPLERALERGLNVFGRDKIACPLAPQANCPLEPLNCSQCQLEVFSKPPDSRLGQ